MLIARRTKDRTWEKLEKKVVRKKRWVYVNTLEELEREAALHPDLSTVYPVYIGDNPPPGYTRDRYCLPAIEE
jgi:hypothetical protein